MALDEGWNVRTPNLLRWSTGLAAAALASAFVLQRGEDQNWDLFSYHYFSGYSFLNGRFAADVLPTSIQTYLNPIPNVLTFLAYSKLVFPLSSLLLLAVQLLVIPALMLVGREIGKTLGHSETTVSEIAALILGLASPMWWSELGTSFYSSTTATLIILGVWLMLRGAAAGPSSRNAALMIASSGLLLGLSAALKLTNAFFVVAGVVGLVPLFFRFKIRSAILLAIAYVVGVVTSGAVMGWWYLPVFNEYGNPIFPLYNALFKSPYFEAINYHDDRFAFRDVGQVIVYLGSVPFGTSKTLEFEFADARIPLCAALVLVALIRSVSSRRGRHEFGPGAAVHLWFIAAGLATWALVFAYQRYLVPIELLLGFAAWILLEYVLELETRVVAALGICILISIAFIRIPDWGHRQPDGDPTSNIFGLQLPEGLAKSPAEFLIAGFPNGFILPFLHSDSHFYRIDFSPKLFGRIRERLNKFHNRPVKLLAMKESQDKAIEAARELGYELARPCTMFASNIDTYVTCDMRRR